MPSYAPLPNVLLDPRNEAQLVQAAARRVYESSNATINDFTSGSPIMALLEGQAFAQSELLQFANQFPESVLVEWIGPFLGALRRTGAPAEVEITFTITPRDQQFDVFEGYLLNTDPSLTNGESISFATVERLVIPPYGETGTVRAVSLFKGRGANVPANTIVRSGTSLAGVESVTNIEAAQGGLNVELISEVKERFFSLIRRRNPVSAEDWQDFFTDALGPGTAVSILGRRSEQSTYLYGGPHQSYFETSGQTTLTQYGGDYIQTNPSVSFFVLNPDGTPITSTQQGALQNLIKWSLPLEFQGFVYPMEVDDVDLVLDLQYDPSKPYAQDLLALSKSLRDGSFNVMVPNAVFPISYQPQVNDVESTLVTAYSLITGTNNQFVDPSITLLKAYTTPTSMGLSEFQGLTPLPFISGNTIQADDLVVVQGNVSSSNYRALTSFNPEINTRSYYTNLGNLALKMVRDIVAGEFTRGDVITVGGALHVVLNDFSYAPDRVTLAELISNGYLSIARTFTTWEQGDFTPFDENDKYDPPIFEYVQGDSKTVTAFSPPASSGEVGVPVGARVNALVYVVDKAFTVTENTTTLATAQTLGMISAEKSNVEILVRSRAYEAGDYIRTPVLNDLIPARVRTDNCYIDPVNGVIPFYALVNEGFSFIFEDGQDYASAFDALVAAGTVTTVQTILFEDCKGDPTFEDRPFRYEARFFMGEYLRFRPRGGFDADLLEVCSDQSTDCTTPECQSLLEANLPLPRYFQALRDFTPTTTDVDAMVDAGDIIEVTGTLFSSEYSITLRKNVQVSTDNITNQLIEDGYIVAVSDLTVGERAAVYDEGGNSRGVYTWSSNLWLYLEPSLPTHRDIFRFAPGDVVAFRNLSEIRQYVATEHVTPVLSLQVYFDNGIFVPSQVSQTISWFDPDYHLENVIYNDSQGAISFFRAISSFTPPAKREIWNGSTQATNARIEEIYQNLLKFVALSSCEDKIATRLRDAASALKLGKIQLNMASKSIGSQANSFVYESAPTVNQAAQVSYFPGTKFTYKPVDYGTGTLAL